jgi:hypothetical protein
MALIKLVNSIKAIADAIREKTGDTAPMTLDEMAESIEYLEGDGGPIQTFILIDEDGHEMQAFLTEEEVVLDATPNDIRIGMTAVTDTGVTVGEKEIPGYITTQGKRGIKPGSRLEIPMYSDKYQYNKLLVVICDYNTNLTNSVSATMIVVDDFVYKVGSTIPVSNVIRKTENQSIDLGIINDKDDMLVIRYVTIKENL